MSTTPGKKTKDRQVVRVKWNGTTDLCKTCVDALFYYCEAAGLDDPGTEPHFVIPWEWYLASEKLGCPHGLKKIVVSAYVENK